MFKTRNILRIVDNYELIDNDVDEELIKYLDFKNLEIDEIYYLSKKMKY